ncbi:MAG: NADH-quinone oxidoreductase subunit K, partial [Pseudolabrys sp.]
MNSAALFGYCGAVLVGLGLYGLITRPEVLRKILAFNVLGSGVFLLFGVFARRGAAAGLGADPVPQAHTAGDAECKRDFVFRFDSAGQGDRG